MSVTLGPRPVSDPQGRLRDTRSEDWLFAREVGDIDGLEVALRDLHEWPRCQGIDVQGLASCSSDFDFFHVLSYSLHFAERVAANMGGIVEDAPRENTRC
jgi:hypothetical protein